MADEVNSDAPVSDTDAPQGEPSPALEEAPAMEAPVAAAPPTATPSTDEGRREGEPELELPSADEVPLVHKHFTAPALIPLERVADDASFLMREAAELEDVAGLATELARLGQLFPIDVRLVPPDRFQVITGFRRVAALRFLQREKVLARLHTDLSDADALLMSLASAIHSRAVGREALEATRAELEAQGRLSPAVRDMLEKALATEASLAPEQVEEEVDADELAADVTLRLGQCNQDLSLLADVFAELEPGRREELLTQLRYSVDLVAFLEGKS